jgi:hypothetical protein
LAIVQLSEAITAFRGAITGTSSTKPQPGGRYGMPEVMITRPAKVQHHKISGDSWPKVGHYYYFISIHGILWYMLDGYMEY